MRKSILLLSLFCIVLASNAQVETNELPPSFYAQSEKTSDVTYRQVLSTPDLSVLKQEDKVEDKLKDIPWRFGTAIATDLTLLNSGEWIVNDDDGTSTWKLKIVAKDALSINLNFDDFVLSKSAKLFLYNNNYSDLLGAITHQNNKADRLFSTRPIKGEELTLELVVPSEEENINVISINEVVYGYRNLHEKANKIFQSSGNCNINVNCPEGDPWKDVKRSVVMITTSSNTRFCSGALVNNVREDETPYLLTAAHCGVRNNAIFIFNYESPNCSPNTDGVLTKSISGASNKAEAFNLGSDFELMELSSTPPASYNVYYAGWSNIDVPPVSSTCIHHPTGDVQKISIDTDRLTNSAYYAAGTTHWQVANWERGTTEGGSSGAPLFDQNQRIVGQLHGGDAACGNMAQDYFGKFAVSWNVNTDSSRQLAYWLDPDSTGATTLEGYDPQPAANNYDVQLINIVNLESYFCDSNISPIITVKNVGNATVDSFFVDYRLGTQPTQSLQYNVTVERNQLKTVNLPNMLVSSGKDSLVTTLRLAGPNADQDISNNSSTKEFQATDPTISEEIIIRLMTDSDGSETTWSIRDRATQETLYKSEPYQDISGGALYIDTLCLFNNCFDFILNDLFGDGFNNGRGNGFALITTLTNDTLLFENNFSNSFVKVDSFCVKGKVGTTVPELPSALEQLSIFPNPVKSGELIQLNRTETYQLNLIDISGKLILQNKSNKLLIPTGLVRGIYFLEIRDQQENNKIATKKIIIN